MKQTIFAIALLFSFASTQAHALIRYDCTEQNGQNSRLLVKTFLARGPYNLLADWSWGQGTRNAGSTHFSGSSIIDTKLHGYPMVDEDGNEAVLTITSTPTPHRPCGRGNCDWDGDFKTTAVLKYMGKEIGFSCH